MLSEPAVTTMPYRIYLLLSFALCCSSVFGASDNSLLWRDPGSVETLDFVSGPGGAHNVPRPPFVFQQEQDGGTGAKILVTDANKNEWEVKWGEETKPEVFSTRLLWATGYIVEPAYFVGSGKIDSVGHLTRAAPQIDRANGNAFRNARFELRDKKSSPLPTSNWAWSKNPFLGSHELAGLRIMSMLVSNWDTKDGTSTDGPNTEILRVKLDDGREEMHYLVNDWGATLGKWGNIAQRGKWDCEGYRRESAGFVKGVDAHGAVGFSYKGKHTSRIAEGITVADVQWLMKYLGRITDSQIREGLKASGATEHETECFGQALRSRIEQLRQVADQAPTRASRLK